MAISLRLPRTLERKIAATAKARGISKSELIRQCVEEKLADAQAGPTAWELGKDLFGRWGSGQGDLSVRVEEIVRERIHAKHAKRQQNCG